MNREDGRASSNRALQGMGRGLGLILVEKEATREFQAESNMKWFTSEWGNRKLCQVQDNAMIRYLLEKMWCELDLEHWVQFGEARKNWQKVSGRAYIGTGQGITQHKA